MSTYKPEADVYTSGGPFITLTMSDGTSTVDLIIELREAYALAAAIEHIADVGARGDEGGISVAISP